MPETTTARQRRLLRFYLRHESTDISFGAACAGYSKAWLALGAEFAVAVALIWAGWSILGVLLLGSCLGSLLRDLGRIYHQVTWWPMLRQVLDWQRVRVLAVGRESDAA